jgi:hypothetical protein
VIAHQGNHLALAARGLALQPHQVLDDFQRIRATVHRIAGLDQNGIPPDPSAIAVDELGCARNVPPGGKIAMQVANRYDPVQGGWRRNRRRGQDQGRQQASTARPKPPQMRTLIAHSVMLSDPGSMCKHCPRMGGPVQLPAGAGTRICR